MNKTLHRKLIEKHLYDHTPALLYGQGEGMLHEMNLLREAAKDLLKPRPQAVANLLKMARGL